MAEKPIDIHETYAKGQNPFVHHKAIHALMLGNPAAVGRPYNKQEIETFLKRHNITHIPSSQHKDAVNLRINTGEGFKAAMRDLARSFQRKDRSLLGKALSIPGIPATFLTKLRGSDHYDPGAHSVNVYGKSPAILAHEIGHAINQSSTKHPTLRSIALRFTPGGILREERAASHHAMKMLSESPDYSKQDIQRASRKLHAAYGTYAAGAGLAALGGARKLINMSVDARKARSAKKLLIPRRNDLRGSRVKAVRQWRIGKAIDKHVPAALRRASDWAGRHHKPIAAGVLAAAVLGGHLLGRHRAKKWVKEHHKDDPNSMLELPGTNKGFAAAQAGLIENVKRLPKTTS